MLNSSTPSKAICRRPSGPLNWPRRPPMSCRSSQSTPRCPGPTPSQGTYHHIPGGLDHRSGGRGQPPPSGAAWSASPAPGARAPMARRATRPGSAPSVFEHCNSSLLATCYRPRPCTRHSHARTTTTTPTHPAVRPTAGPARSARPPHTEASKVRPPRTAPPPDQLAGLRIDPHATMLRACTSSPELVRSEDTRPTAIADTTG